MNSIKIPQTKYPILDVLKNRWSARSFSDKKISQEALNQLLEAAAWAFSSMNEQPWRYIYAFKGEPAFDQLWNCLMAGNQPWAKDAAVLILSLANTKFANGNSNRHAYHDVGAANANLLTEATANSIYGHLMGGFDYPKTQNEFNLPEHLEPVAIIALGYLDDPKKLEEPFLSRELTGRTRKPLDEISFHNKL